MKIGMRTGHEKEEDKRGKHRPRWDRRVIGSLGVEESEDPSERMVEYVNKKMPCANGRTYEDDSEGSHMISLMSPQGFTQAPSAGRSFNEMCGSYAFRLDHVLLQSTKSRWSRIS